MIAYFARHPVAANLMMAAFLILGLIALPDLQRETFPRIPPTRVEISVVYAGATAEEVEETLCLRIEDALDGVENLDEVRCVAADGRATATAEMLEGHDLARFLDDVKTEVEAIDSFPDGIEIPVIRDLGRTDFVASVAVTGPMDDVDLKTYAEGVKDRMQRIAGISIVEIKGFSDMQIRVELEAETLRQYGLTVAGVANQIGRQSVGRPAGTLETTAGDLILRFDDERKLARSFSDIVVLSGGTGGEVLLGDVARVTERFEKAEDKVFYKGRRAAKLDVIKTRNQDSLTVITALRNFLETERATGPPGVEIAVTHDMTSITRDRLDMLTRNGSQGLVLVFLTMWLFFSFRYSFWVTMGLPVSFLGALFLMAAIGYSLNMITMVALIIAIGLLMDDAIVISENIQTHIRHGARPIEAAINGSRQVLPGVVSSFLTTVLVFGSLAFMEGHMGAVLKVLPVVLIMVLSVSLIEAFLILPHHLSHAVGSTHGAGLPKETAAGAEPARPGGFRARFEAGFTWLREDVFGPWLDRAIEWRYLTVGLMAAFLIASLSLVAGGFLKFQAFPDLESNIVEARILLPQGTPLERTEAVVARVVEAAETMNAEFKPRQPEGRDLVEAITQRYSYNEDAFESGPHVATVMLDLLNAEVRDAPMAEVEPRWRELVGELPDVINIRFTEREVGPAGKAIDIRLYGDDLTRLKQASLALMDWLSGYAAVRDLSDDLRPGKPEIRVKLKEGAGALGITADDIAAQLRAAFHGVTVTEIQRGSDAFEVDVRLAAADRDSLADLDYFTVTAAGGSRQIPLSAVVEVSLERGFARINRARGRRVVTIQGDVDTAAANTSSIISDMEARFVPELERRFPGITVGLKGQAEQTEKTSSSLIRNFSVAIIGIFLLLSFQFRNYVEPLIVMAAIPMGLIGALWGHVALGQTFSMPSVVGFASLAGVVVNDTILIVTFVKLSRKDGLGAIEAARIAGRRRFRAVVLTSLTTIMGLTPLLLEKSLQAQVMIPLATSLAFGLLSATVLSLFLVPALYCIFDDFGWTGASDTEEEELAAKDTAAAVGAPKLDS